MTQSESGEVGSRESGVGKAAQSRITVEIKMYKKGHLNWTYGTTTSASIAAHTHADTDTATFYSYYYRQWERDCRYYSYQQQQQQQ